MYLLSLYHVYSRSYSTCYKTRIYVYNRLYAFDIYHCSTISKWIELYCQWMAGGGVDGLKVVGPQ